MGLASKIKNNEASPAASIPHGQNGQYFGQAPPSAPPLYGPPKAAATAPPQQQQQQRYGQQQQPRPFYGVAYADSGQYPGPPYSPQEKYSYPQVNSAYSPPPQRSQPPAMPPVDQPAASHFPMAYPYSPQQSQYAGAGFQNGPPNPIPPQAPYQPPPTHTQYPNGTSNSMDFLVKKLQSIVHANGLQRFYDHPTRLQAVLQRVASINFGEIASQWKIGKELAYDLAPLALYDIVFYCDDSGSMAFEENGDRINDLNLILSKVSSIATLFDDDGIIVRFMNSNVNGDGVRSAADVGQLMTQVTFHGATPLGTNFDKKVIQPFVLGQAMGSTASMAKPVLAIIITDGEPYGESKDTIVQVIRRAKDVLARTPYGGGALAVQIAQVGKDPRTQKFLEALDKDPIVGRMIDCTSYYEMEEEEFARKGVTLTPELWLLKMCVGAIDPEYDSKDD